MIRKLGHHNMFSNYCYIINAVYQCGDYYTPITNQHKVVNNENCSGKHVNPLKLKLRSAQA